MRNFLHATKMRLDLHVHSCYSYDSLCSIESLMKAAKRKKLDGIAITDHNTAKGWKEAKKIARKLKLFFVPGEEIKCKEGIEVLGLWLKKEISPGSFEEIVEEIRKQKGVSVLAHPTRIPKKIKIENYAKKVDAIEVFNSRSNNEKAKLLASKLKKSLTGGSDAHSCFELGSSWTEAKARTLSEFKKALLLGKTKVQGKKSPFFVHFFSTIAKFKILLSAKH